MESLTFPLGLTFDDVLLLPGFANFSRADIDLSTQLTKKIRLSLPFVSAPMDTVTESELAIALATLGGIGIIHRNLSTNDQANEVALVKKQNLLVGAAIGPGTGYEERVAALVKAGVDVIVVDSAHGYATPIIETIQYIKKMYPDLEIIGGNIATYDGAKALIEAGATALRVGMGPGAICTTRIISGMGVPQITAIMETVRGAKGTGVPVIADGGIKYSGDMVKALAAGASSVMMGSFFASALEAPGRTVMLAKKFVPRRFLSVFGETDKVLPPSEEKTVKGGEVVINDQTLTSGSDEEVYRFKEYRGMGSVGAMEHGAKIKSEGEFHGKSYKDRVLVAEGVEGLVPVKGTVKELMDQAVGGIKSGLYYIGAQTIDQLQKEAKFIQITHASLKESHPHDVLVTNAGKNY